MSKSKTRANEWEARSRSGDRWSEEFDLLDFNDIVVEEEMQKQVELRNHLTLWKMLDDAVNVGIKKQQNNVDKK